MLEARHTGRKEREVSETIWNCPGCSRPLSDDCPELCDRCSGRAKPPARRARRAPDPTPAEQPAEDGAVCATCGGWKCLCQSRDLLAACVPCPDCATPAPEPATWCPVHGAGVPVDDVGLARDYGHCMRWDEHYNRPCRQRATGPGAEAAVKAVDRSYDADLARDVDYMREVNELARRSIRRAEAAERERDTAIAEVERLRAQLAEAQAERDRKGPLKGSPNV